MKLVPEKTVSKKIVLENFQRILVTGDFIFSSSYDKSIKAWLFDTSELGPMS
jgi:hypothetical protein